MNIEELRELCLSFPSVTEDIKWEDNLTFLVAGKIFCLVDLQPPLNVAFKIPEEEFFDLTSAPDIIQASHFAKRKWVVVINQERFTRNEWEYYLKQSYELVKAGLSKKLRNSLEGLK